MIHVDGHGIASDLLLSENGKVRVNSKIVVTHDSYLRLDAGGDGNYIMAFGYSVSLL